MDKWLKQLMYVNIFQYKKCEIILIMIVWNKSSFVENNASPNLL